MDRRLSSTNSASNPGYGVEVCVSLTHLIGGGDNIGGLMRTGPQTQSEFDGVATVAPAPVDTLQA
jgi:hypothetical protein